MQRSNERPHRPVVDKEKWTQDCCHIYNYLVHGLNSHGKGSNERRELPRKARKYFAKDSKLWLMKTDKKCNSKFLSHFIVEQVLH